MPTLGRFRRELRWKRFWSVPVEREVDSELAFHLDMRVRELIDQGMNPADARVAALQRFGDLDRITEACRSIIVDATADEARCSCSLGVTEVRPDDERLDNVLTRADQALYAAKRAGRNQWSFAA